MKPWLLTAYKRPTSNGLEQGLSIFLVGGDWAVEQLDAEIAARLREITPLDFVHFVGHQDEISAIKALLQREDAILFDRLLQALRQNCAPLFFHFDVQEGRQVCTDIANHRYDDPALADTECRFSLMNVFRAAGGEESAPAGTHYAKTSESHCNRFLRVSNVLEQGCNVALVAFWLLPHIWRKNVDYVAVDTSGIYSVAILAIQDTLRLGGMATRPLVWSHRSHEGVSDIPRHVAERSLFLVSASTSNGLVQRLIRQGSRAEGIKTLFSLATDEIHGHSALCNLRNESANDEIGLKPIENLAASNCPLCKQHFHVIDIRGDQFSISPPRVTAVDIVAKDLDESIRPALSALSGLGAFFAYRRRADDRICSLGIDVTPLMSHELPKKSREFLERLQVRWASALRRSQTFGLRNVVSCSYPGSREIAQAILDQAHLVLANSQDVEVVLSSCLRDRAPIACTSTIVVSACVDEAHELLSVSRNLRDVQDSGMTSYLTIAQLISSKGDAKRLRNNLTFGALGPNTFNYSTCMEIQVDCYEDEPSWRTELKELRRIVSWLDNQELDVPDLIETRISRLEKAPSIGMTTDLFWPDLNGEPLRLRSDFTLIEGSLSDPKATQADLYAVICVVLTALRNNENPKRRLAQKPYERGVLSPANFDRFNDGVLQACLLRAAKPNELAYGACESSLSKEMLNILKDSLPSAGQPEKAEAILEFLLAMITGRLTLLSVHLSEYLEALLRTTQEGGVAYIFGKYLKAKLEGAIFPS